MNEQLQQETKLCEETIEAPCAKCDRVTRHKILATTDTNWQSDDGHIDVWLQHQIIQCQGCLTNSFREVYQCSEEWDIDPITGDHYLPSTIKYYPNRITGRPLMQDAYHLPHGVYSIYKEAHSSLCNNLNIMAGFGIRAIVEAVCKDKTIAGRNLQDRIDGLKDNGFITSPAADILHNLRFMGNAAAHEMRTHKMQELDAAFTVVEHLLQTVYIITFHASKLPQRNS